MDETELRMSELEDRVEELEKLCGALSVQLKKTESAAIGFAEQADVLSHENAQLLLRVAKLEQTVSELSDDVDDTIEDFNTLSDEMHRRWRRLLAKQEHQRWVRRNEYDDGGTAEDGGEYDDEEDDSGEAED